MKSYFAKNLKYLRTKKNIDQQIMADDLKVPRSTLSCWETGARTPKIEQIIDIANYLGVKIDIVSKDYETGEIINSDDNDKKLREILLKKGIMDKNGNIDEKQLENLLDLAIKVKNLTNEKEH